MSPPSYDGHSSTPVCPSVSPSIGASRDRPGLNWIDSTRSDLNWIDSTRSDLNWINSTRSDLNWINSTRSDLNWINSTRPDLNWIDPIRSDPDWFGTECFILGSRILEYVITGDRYTGDRLIG